MVHVTLNGWWIESYLKRKGLSLSELLSQYFTCMHWEKSRNILGSWCACRYLKRVFDQHEPRALLPKWAHALFHSVRNVISFSSSQFEKLLVPQFVMSLPTLCGVENFVTVITRGRLFSLFPFISLHSALSHPVPNIVFLSCLRHPKQPLPSGFPTGIVLLYAFCISAIHVTFSANYTVSIE
jgi:hypothetical protein